MMYVHVWTKYLPIIKIMMKKSQAADQTLELNRIDFERAGSGRKSGYKFNIEFKRGRVSNVISSSPLASDLASVLLNDPASRAILGTGDISISLNTKFQLHFKFAGSGENGSVGEVNGSHELRNQDGAGDTVKPGSDSEEAY